MKLHDLNIPDSDCVEIRYPYQFRNHDRTILQGHFPNGCRHMLCKSEIQQTIPLKVMGVSAMFIFILR